jgi:hypothetical protein
MDEVLYAEESYAIRGVGPSEGFLLSPRIIRNTGPLIIIDQAPEV